MFEVRGKGKYLPRWMGDGGNFSAGVEFEWVRDRVAVLDSTAAALVRPGAKEGDGRNRCEPATVTSGAKARLIMRRLRHG